MITIVTILILIDGFLQFRYNSITPSECDCHNPYFNRWFSAIWKMNYGKKSYPSHNPYFNRWFSAI